MRSKSHLANQRSSSARHPARHPLTWSIGLCWKIASTVYLCLVWLRMLLLQMRSLPACASTLPGPGWWVWRAHQRMRASRTALRCVSVSFSAASTMIRLSRRYRMPRKVAVGACARWKSPSPGEVMARAGHLWQAVICKSIARVWEAEARQNAESLECIGSYG